MSEISPNGKVKSFAIKNWGTKYRPLRVWCCVVALPDKYELLVIQETYGKYCDNLLFFVGDDEQKEIENHQIQYYKDHGHGPTLKNVIYLPLNCTGEGIDIDRWEKNWKMYRYLHRYHANEFEWIIRLDTDAWFSTPNFRGYAQYLDPDQPWYFGNVLTHDWRQRTRKNIVFVAGGVTVLSRESIRLLNRVFETNEFLERPIAGLGTSICGIGCSYVDDVFVAQCLRTVGVFPMNTLDEHFRGRFFCESHTGVKGMGGGDWWYWQDRFEKTATKKHAIVERAIGFHNYKDANKDKSNRRKAWLELHAKYIEPSIRNWANHPLPPKPVTFLFNTSFNEFDEYFNIGNPPQKQKIWKGVDNLWNYSESSDLQQ